MEISFQETGGEGDEGMGIRAEDRKELVVRKPEKGSLGSIANLLCDPSHIASLEPSSSSIIKRISCLHLWRGCCKHGRQWWM